MFATSFIHRIPLARRSRPQVTSFIHRIVARLSRPIHVAAALSNASTSILQQLSTNNFAVIPNFFASSLHPLPHSPPTTLPTFTQPESNCAQMRAEATHFFESERFRISQSTRWSTSVPPELEYYDKLNVHSMMLDPTEDIAPILQEYIHDMASLIVPLVNANCAHVQLSNTTDQQVINKLAVCTGDGSGYEQHIDNTGSDERRLTVILYLNEWDPSQQGQFRIHSPMKDTTVSPLVEPNADTLVVFWSDQLLHSTLPSFAPDGKDSFRYALTLWFNGTRTTVE